MTDTNPTPDNDKPAADRHVKRRERTEQAILDAAEELIAEGGVDGLTIEGVAARSGVAKTTIYRRWRDKDELALAILVDRTATISPPRDAGDTRKELLTFLKAAKRVIRPGGIAQGLASDIATKPQLGRIYRERIVDVRRSELKTVIDRGIARGDFRPDTDVWVAHELLIGPLYYRLLFSGAPLDTKHDNQLIDALLRAFAPEEGKQGTKTSLRGGHAAGDCRPAKRRRDTERGTIASCEPGTAASSAQAPRRTSPTTRFARASTSACGRRPKSQAEVL
jgi:AcrR family transcriptional regulator